MVGGTTIKTGGLEAKTVSFRAKPEYDGRIVQVVISQSTTGKQVVSSNRFVIKIRPNDGSYVPPPEIQPMPNVPPTPPSPPSPPNHGSGGSGNNGGGSNHGSGSTTPSYPS